MRRIAHIGSLVKQIYRLYSLELLRDLENHGFSDLRPSFLEILIYLCEHETPSIKMIGKSCGLKKQTMTSHLNELEKRGYLRREHSTVDKREQLVRLTDFGIKFKVIMLQSIHDLENYYAKKIGQVELDRVELMLEKFFETLKSQKNKGSLI
jgi:DNA-binding MarR family transcriptional regulator